MEYCLTESNHKGVIGQGILELVNEIFLVFWGFSTEMMSRKTDVPGLKDKGGVELCPFFILKKSRSSKWIQGIYYNEKRHQSMA